MVGIIKSKKEGLEMVNMKEFFDAAKVYLEKAKDTQREPIKKVAKMFCDTIQEDGLVQLVGINSGYAFSMELGYRAGGLMGFHQFNTKDLAIRGLITEEELKADDFDDKTEYVQMLWDLYNINEKDMFVFVSYIGNEPILVEAAIKAKNLGRKVVAVVSKELCDQAPARHESGKKVTDFADIIIDTCAPNPDALLTIEGNIKINQVSTICGNVIAQMITAEAYKCFVDQGLPVPVLLSANTTGADVHNKALSDRYDGRWNA